MSANGISDPSNTKRERQDAKLAYSEAKRKGQVITEGGGTWSADGVDNPSANWYRTLNTLDADLLPSRYAVGDNDTNNVVDGDPGPLDQGRPWT